MSNIAVVIWLDEDNFRQYHLKLEFIESTRKIPNQVGGRGADRLAVTAPYTIWNLTSSGKNTDSVGEFRLVVIDKLEKRIGGQRAWNNVVSRLVHKHEAMPQC